MLPPEALIGLIVVALAYGFLSSRRDRLSLGVASGGIVVAGSLGLMIWVMLEKRFPGWLPGGARAAIAIAAVIGIVAFEIRTSPRNPSDRV